MQKNGLDENYYHLHRIPIASTMFQYGLIGAAAGGALSYLKKVKPDSFEKRASQIIDKNAKNEFIQTVKKENLTQYANMYNSKTLKETLKEDGKLLKGVQKLISKYKNQRALGQAGTYGLVGAGVGLVLGLIFNTIEGKPQKE